MGPESNIAKSVTCEGFFSLILIFWAVFTGHTIFAQSSNHPRYGISSEKWHHFQQQENPSKTSHISIASGAFTNGGFEYGYFRRWITEDLSMAFFPLSVGSAGIDPGLGFFTSAPTEGSFAALHGFDGNGPGTIRMAQDVSLPAGAMTLEFDYRAAWDLVTNCGGCSGSRLFMVNIEPGGGGPALQSDTLLVAEPNSQVPDSGNLHGSIDVTPFAGDVIRVSFAWYVPENSTGPGFFQLDDVYIVASGPQINASPEIIDYGNVAVGIDSTKPLLIRNIGTEDLTVTEISDPATPYILSGVPTLPVVIPPGSSETIDVTFSPTADGSSISKITISSNDPDDPSVNVVLLGEGEALSTVDALIWDPVATMNAEQVLERAKTVHGNTLAKSAGEAEALLSNRSLSGAEIAAALDANGVSNATQPSLPASIPENIKYLFVVVGQFPASIVIPEGSLAATTIDDFIAAGGHVYMEGGDVWYFDPLNGGHDFASTFGIHAVADGLFGGEFTSILGSNLIDGQNFAYTVGTDNFPDHIEPSPSGLLLHSNQSPPFDCGVGRPFGPGTPGRGRTIGNSFEFGQLVDGASPATKAELMARYLDFFENGFILGEGPQIHTAPLPIDFGILGLGISSLSVTITIRSFGTEDLTVSAISDPGGLYTLSHVPSLPAVIPPGGWESFDVTFTPSEVGTFDASITVTSNDADNLIMEIPLTGQVAIAGQNVELIANVNDYPQVGYSDVWGYTAPNGDEYALLGTIDGVSIVNVTNPNNIAEVDYVPFVLTPPYGWYDMKTYQNYMYVSTEGSLSLLIVDLSPLPDSVSVVGTYSGLSSTPHNISIDTEMGILYVIEDFHFDPAVRIVSLSDPLHPVELSTIGTVNLGTDSHDAFAQDSLLYIAEGSNPTIGIFDVSDPANPSLINRIVIPAAGYVHQVWVTEDNNYMVTTEETPEKTVKIWDIQDIYDISLVGEYLGDSQIAHNAYFKENLIYISHYESGLKVLDFSDPTNAVEVGSYDTYLNGESSVFPWHGAWGAYPFTRNGMVFVSDRQTGLYVLHFEEIGVGIDDDKPGLPIEFALEQNYPNPFNPNTAIKYTLTENAQVTLKIYNMLGQLVKTLVNEKQTAGNKEVQWDGTDEFGVKAASGVFIYKIEANDFVKSKKMILLR